MKYKINDTIIDKNGNTKTILEIFKNYYIISKYNFKTINKLLWTQEELDNSGYKLQVTKWTPEINEDYYFVNIVENCVGTIDWISDKIDNNNKNNNLIFPATPKGKEQAEARLLEVIAFLKK